MAKYTWFTVSPVQWCMTEKYMQHRAHTGYGYTQIRSLFGDIQRKWNTFLECKCRYKRKPAYPTSPKITCSLVMFLASGKEGPLDTVEVKYFLSQYPALHCSINEWPNLWLWIYSKKVWAFLLDTKMCKVPDWKLKS